MPLNVRSGKPRASALTTLLGSVLGTWCCTVVGPLGYVFPFVAAGCLTYFLIRRRWVMALVYVALLPTSVAFVTGIVDYVTGNASLRYSGLPCTEFHNLDPDLRCGRTTYGCVVHGNEWIMQIPYNTTVRLLITTLGFMPGTYTGPYPSRVEAIEAVRQGVPISAVDLSEDRVAVDKDECRLDKNVGEELLTKSFYPVNTSEIRAEMTLPAIKAANWREECILLRIPFNPLYLSESAMVVLVSREKGRPFAYYAEGEYSHHFPPVSWRADGTDNPRHGMDPTRENRETARTAK